MKIQVCPSIVLIIKNNLPIALNNFALVDLYAIDITCTFYDFLFGVFQLETGDLG